MNKINYKLINILIMLLIIISSLYLINSYTSFDMIKKIINPIILSFFLSYSFYPIIKILNKKISYNISCTIFLSVFFIFLIILIYLLFNIIKKEYLNLVIDIDQFFSLISYINIDLSYLKKLLLSYLDIDLITNSYSYLINTILILILIIYFTYNMENIRKLFKKNILLTNIDNSLISYYKGFYLVILIEGILYTLFYFLIGHPYFLLIGFLSIITSLIPVIGSIVLNIFALISAYFINDSIFIMTSIILLILPIINNYIIEPKIYKKKVNIPFISVILSCFIFGTIFGFIGIVLSIPLYIIIKNIYLIKKEHLAQK